MSSLDPRDRAIEAVLRAGNAPGAPSSDCLDAETLAAWMDGGLDATTLQRAEAHMAVCAHCQAMMAALVDTPPIEPAPATGAAGLIKPWWHVDLKWLMPLAGAATALLVWVAIPDDRDPSRIQPEQNVAMSSPSEAPAPSTPSAAPPPAAPQADPSAQTAEKQLSERVPPAKAAREEAGERSADLQMKAAAPATADSMTAPPASSPTAGATPPASGASAPLTAARSAESDTELRRNRVAGLTAGTSSAFGGIASRDQAVQWRFAGQGAIERSTDGGASWARTNTGDAAALAAGMAPSATVCWVVGRGGLVLLTTDAREWRRLPPPTSDDLVAVDATSDRQATVRTATGVVFQTTDAGATWLRSTK